MADVAEDIEAGQTLLIVGAVAVAVYTIYELLSPIIKALTTTGNVIQFAGGQIGEGRLAGPARGFADGSAMTPGVYSSLVKILGASDRGGSAQKSPDGKQIWFADGSYYDNTTGHYYLADGSDQGMAF